VVQALEIKHDQYGRMEITMAFKINADTRTTIENILGRSIEAECGDLANYGEIVDKDLESFRRLWPTGAVITANYLLYRLDGRYGLQKAMMYIHHVIGVEDMTADQWLKQMLTLEQ